MRTQSRNVKVLCEVRRQVLCQGHEEVQMRRQEVCREMRAEVYCQVRPEMRSQMYAEVRSEELIAVSGPQTLPLTDDGERAAGLRLLETYTGLAKRGTHLFGDLLGSQMPKQWRHYPDDDAIDPRSGFHWFYHSHSPQDRPGASEHGHVHLFARRKLWARRLRSARGIEFSKLTGEPATTGNTRHLLTIGFDAKGIPATLFTVNSWVTGDRMLSAGLTAELLAAMKLDTGNKAVDAVIESLARLYRDDICELLNQRDKALLTWGAGNVLSDDRLEVLSEIRIDVDGKLRSTA